MVKRNLERPVLAMFIRFLPKEWKSWPCMRVEVYGKPASKSTKKSPQSVEFFNSRAILGPVQTSCFCRAELNSGIKFDKSTAKARRLNQTFELSSASN